MPGTVRMSLCGKIRLDDTFMWHTAVSNGGAKMESVADHYEAIQKAAEFIRGTDRVNTPHLYVEVDGLLLIGTSVTDRIVWPRPAFFWKGFERFNSDAPYARLWCYDDQMRGDYKEKVKRWAELATYRNLVIDRDKRDDLQWFATMAILALAEIPMRSADSVRLVESAALLAWLSAQENTPWTEKRAEAYEVVLTLIDQLLDA